MNIDSLEKLLIHEMKDLYSAEGQILKALPEMIEAATSPELKTAFSDHLKETHKHRERLEKAFKMTGFAPGGAHCAGCEGLLKEGADIIQSIEKGDLRDAGLITAAQRVEHYEMAGYGGIIAFARKLGKNGIAELLTETLEEEGQADRLLSRIAEKAVNFKAMAHA
ncbi:ferritin-like domain-containing protein [Luteolibacter marinus]|uniref:YciE/YciF ferroxidase family protein n=1 Tax=Luteolibacter marinus TaxID=2776705 RepID=UPI001868E016|nr:ferritin-like domain-containing protein [Luteolibacter marinus]